MGRGNSNLSWKPRVLLSEPLKMYPFNQFPYEETSSAGVLPFPKNDPLCCQTYDSALVCGSVRGFRTAKQDYSCVRFSLYIITEQNRDILPEKHTLQTKTKYLTVAWWCSELTITLLTHGAYVHLCLPTFLKITNIAFILISQGTGWCGSMQTHAETLTCTQTFWHRKCDRWCVHWYYLILKKTKKPQNIALLSRWIVSSN